MPWVAKFPDQPLLPTQTRQAAAAELQKLPGRVLARVKPYPPQRPATGSGQSLGKRAGASTAKRTATGPKTYRRTGTLGRNWRPILQLSGANELAAGVENPTPYEGYVQGNEQRPQTADMASRGWASAVEVFDDEVQKTFAILGAIYTGKR